ncbi:MAG: radical SAM family heme chaperone HemW [Cytophagales bacterium]|nr:radical SAM family heme chaperone HemW [Cytophagales bacterium]
MAGIYIHIPFCTQACHYCDFHFSTNTSKTDALVNALCKELIFRKDFLYNNPIHTIYFGGGTPSVLNQKHLSNIFETLHQHYNMSQVIETTIEVNPEDIDKAKILQYKSFNINRLSIGIQTFDDQILQWMNRSHTATQSIECINMIKDAGYNNLSADLIYGLPSPYHESFENDVNTLLTYDIPHLSCYQLTIEPNTVFGKKYAKKLLAPAEDEIVATQFEHLINALYKAEYIHYEISNFAQKDYQSIHNSAYWKGEKYLGIGPSAHSYDGTHRYSNISNNELYVQNINKNIIPINTEALTEHDLINEYTLCSLRTMHGIDINLLAKYPTFDLINYTNTLMKYMTTGHIIQSGDKYTLTTKGKLIADTVISDLFISPRYEAIS